MKIPHDSDLSFGIFFFFRSYPLHKGPSDKDSNTWKPWLQSSWTAL